MFVNALGAPEKNTRPPLTASDSADDPRTESVPAPSFSTATFAVQRALSVAFTSCAPSTSVPVADAVFVTMPMLEPVPVLVTLFRCWRRPYRSRQQWCWFWFAFPSA